MQYHYLPPQLVHYIIVYYIEFREFNYMDIRTKSFQAF